MPKDINKHNITKCQEIALMVESLAMNITWHTFHNRVCFTIPQMV